LFSDIIGSLKNEDNPSDYKASGISRRERASTQVKEILPVEVNVGGLVKIFNQQIQKLGDNVTRLHNQLQIIKGNEERNLESCKAELETSRNELEEEVERNSAAQNSLKEENYRLKAENERLKMKLEATSHETGILQGTSEVTGFSLRTAVSYRHIKYIFVKKNMDRDTAEAACKLLNGTLATPSSYDEFDFLKSHMEWWAYHLGAQCKDCTSVKDDKWEWSTGEPLSLRFGKWGNTGGRKHPFDDGDQDKIYLFAMVGCRTEPNWYCQASLNNVNGKETGHAICQENIAWHGLGLGVQQGEL